MSTTSCGIVRLVPGGQGIPGAAGTNGVDGAAAFTTLTADFTMPAEAASAVASVVSSRGFPVGAIVLLQGAGWLQVAAKPTDASITLTNIENTATGEYAANVPPGTIVATMNELAISGPQGPGGALAGGALLAANNLSDLSNVATAQTNLGLGLLAGLNTVNNNDWSGTALTVGNGGTGATTTATARTALGLGTMAVQAANAVAITGGTAAFTSVSGAVVATSLGVSSAAAFNATVGLGGSVYTPASTLQTLLVASAIAPNAAKVRVVGSGAPVTLVATPTITSPLVDGQLLIVLGTNDTNTVTLQDNATLAGTLLELGAGTRVLGKGDIIVLSWDLTDGKWYEVSFSNV